MNTPLAIKIGILTVGVLIAPMPSGAEDQDFLASPPSTVRKANVTTGHITAILKQKEETKLKVRSESDLKERTMFLKANTPVFKNGKKLKKYRLIKDMRVRATHNNFKGSSRQLVQRLEILPLPKSSDADSA